MIARPQGLLCDYGETLAVEVSVDVRAGTEFLLSHAVAASVNMERIAERIARVTLQVANRRDVFGIETPWPTLTRLIHDYCGTRFTVPIEDLELGYWDASVTTLPMPGAREALLEFRETGVRMGVVSNSSFGQRVVRHESAKHGLAEFFDIVVVSAEYAVRKPNFLLFDTAAARLGVACSEVWFVGDRIDNDVEGARAAGMIPLWLAPIDSSERALSNVVPLTWPDIATMFRESQRA